jgi:DNA primase catalytic core
MTARITKSELLAIKRTVPMAALIGERVPLEKRGKDLVGRCPFAGHERGDVNPSLVVTEDKYLWRCFGCRRTGSVIDWVMNLDGVDFLTAANKLKDRYLPSMATLTSSAKKLLEQLHPNMSEGEVLGVVADYYAACFEVIDEGRAYVKERGLSELTAKRFDVGYAAGTLHQDLPLSSSRSEIKRLLQNVGLLRASSGNEHLRGCITVPLYQGDVVVGFYGRKVQNWRGQEQKHLYLQGQHRGVFNPRAFSSSTTKSAGELIVCEAIIDALSFIEQGHDNVTSSFGADGFTDELEHLIVTNNIQRVLCAYDGDAAGDEGFEKLSGRLSRRGIEVVRVPIPRGLDANDLLKTGEPLAQFLTSTVAKRSDMTPIVVEKPQSSSSLSAVTAAEGLIEASDDEAVFVWGERRYRVKGLVRMLPSETLKVQLIASRKDLIHPDTLDLYAAKPRFAFAVGAAHALGVDVNLVNQDLSRIFVTIEQLKRERRAALSAPKIVEVTGEEREQALTLLRDPNLLSRIVADFASCGVVGEEANKLLIYLAATSRKLQKPLAVMVHSSSAAGKSSLVEAALSFIPDEDKHVVSAMTGQALYYMEKNLEHKVVSIAEEEGAKQATYSLKVLQSDGKLRIDAVGTDPQSGKLLTHGYEVKGPISLLLTTTKIDIDEELGNRCIVLTVDESRAQTRRIQAAQRALETLEGQKLYRQRDEVMKLHQNMQRLLEPIAVINNHAPSITFFDEKTRARRDQPKFLTLIRVVTLLHQHQREVKHFADGTPYIEATVDDVAAADQLSRMVLTRSLDEVPPKTRELFSRVLLMVERRQEKHGDEKKTWFTVRDVCEALHLGNSSVAEHFARMVRAELLDVRFESAHSQRKHYCIVPERKLFEEVQPQESAPVPSSSSPPSAGAIAASRREAEEETFQRSEDLPEQGPEGFSGSNPVELLTSERTFRDSTEKTGSTRTRPDVVKKAKKKVA